MARTRNCQLRSQERPQMIVTNILRPLSMIIMLLNISLAYNLQDNLVSVEHQTIRFSIPVKAYTLYGTGICINQGCSVVATTYHIQLAAGMGNLAIAGGRTKKVLSLANASDGNKTDVSVGKRI